MKHIMLLLVSTRSNFLAFESSILITIMKHLNGSKREAFFGQTCQHKGISYSQGLQFSFVHLTVKKVCGEQD